MSQPNQYAALYVYDRSRGSPAPFNFTCAYRGIEFSTTSDRLRGLQLLGANVVDNVNITGTNDPLMLEFDPEFLPQFSGTYDCLRDAPSDFILITTGLSL